MHFKKGAHLNKKLIFIACFLFLFSCTTTAGRVDEAVSNKASVMRPENIALVINDADPSSVKAGEYYRVARGIPAKNIVHVKIVGSSHKLSFSEFTRLQWEIKTQLHSAEQVILLAWTAPYAVECNSITAALTFGFDAKQCENTCAPGKLSPYFNSTSKKPFDDFGIRLAMMLPSDSFQRAKAIIDHGVQSDAGVFRSTAYYLTTSDVNRNSRAQFFPPTGLNIPRSGLAVMNMRSDKLVGARDIMIYETGLAHVDALDTLNFLPGALADHLTSAGGDLYGKSQMTALRWLDAGATASYGTVSEPCNYWQKFPNPAVLLSWYVNGATAVEAYWKSVAWPAQGLFVGEPLAAPYAHQ